MVFIIRMGEVQVNVLDFPSILEKPSLPNKAFGGPKVRRCTAGAFTGKPPCVTMGKLVFVSPGEWKHIALQHHTCETTINVRYSRGFSTLV